MFASSNLVKFQTALNLLASLANPKFTGTISGNTNLTIDATGN